MNGLPTPLSELAEGRLTLLTEAQLDAVAGGNGRDGGFPPDAPTLPPILTPTPKEPPPPWLPGLPDGGGGGRPPREPLPTFLTF